MYILHNIYVMMIVLPPQGGWLSKNQPGSMTSTFSQIIDYSQGVDPEFGNAMGQDLSEAGKNPSNTPKSVF